MTIAFVAGVAVEIDRAVVLVAAADSVVALAVAVVADIGIVVILGAADIAVDVVADTVAVVVAVDTVVAVVAADIVAVVAVALIETGVVEAAAIAFDPVIGVLGVAEMNFLEMCIVLVFVVGGAHVSDRELGTGAEIVVGAEVGAEVGADAADIALCPWALENVAAVVVKVAFAGVGAAGHIAVNSAVHVAVDAVEILAVVAVGVFAVAPLPVLPVVVVAYKIVGSSAQAGFVDMLTDIVHAAAVVHLVTVPVCKGTSFP